MEITFHLTLDVTVCALQTWRKREVKRVFKMILVVLLLRIVFTEYLLAFRLPEPLH